MWRNREVPQNIVANGLGYPLRWKWETSNYTTDTQTLLQEYSDKQLANATDNTKRSKRRWKIAHKISKPATIVPYLATTYFIAVGGFEHYLLNAPLDPIANAIGTIGSVDMNVATLFSNFPAVGAGVLLGSLATEIFGPAVANLITKGMHNKRQGQLATLELEQEERTARKARESITQNQTTVDSTAQA